jgi:hypothetical protein
MKSKIFISTVSVLLICCIALLYNSCNKDEIKLEATQIELISGADQSQFVGEPLINPIEIMVKDQNGNAFKGATINFTVAEGSVSFETATTDASGKASVIWTLGQTPGTQILTITAFKADGKTALSGSPIMVNGTAIPKIPTEGLIAYYPFNGNANDESGNGHQGTVNEVTLSTDGIIDSCLLFNSNSDYVLTGVNLSTTVFTLNIWAKQTNSEKISLGGTMTNPSGGKNGFMFHSGGYGGATVGSAALVSWQSNQSWINFYGTESVNVSDWNMYTFIYLAEGTSKIYSNGVLTATLLNTPANPSHSTPLQIGRSFTTITNINQVWGGYIDEVGIWNAELTQEEINIIYNSGSGLKFL